MKNFSAAGEQRFKKFQLRIDVMTNATCSGVREGNEERNSQALFASFSSVKVLSFRLKPEISPRARTGGTRDRAG
jgi:hypothetical protein